jgi:two-component system response regulator AtoC
MSELQKCQPTDVLIGDSPVIRRIREQLQKAALTEVPVLLTGESGTGKELAARLVHDLGARRSNSFIKVNCPAIPNQLFESELFGHESGAFTGAKEAAAGKCEQADKGTLFLDEIGELDLGLQAKLLHALQDFRIARLGAVDERIIDIRLICVTNRDLEVEVAKGKFRADLFHRINVLRIQMPPLRERVSDVPILLNHFIEIYSMRFGRKPETLSSSFLRLLESYHWPGNVRELENLAKQHIVLGAENVAAVLFGAERHRPFSPSRIDLTTPLRTQTKRAVLHLERKIILGVLQSHNWNRTKTARSLGISYRVLLHKIKEIGLPAVRSNKQAPQDVGEIPR